MAMKYILIELWRSRRTEIMLVGGAVILNIVLTLILLVGMVPSLERDRSELIQYRLAAERASADGPAGAEGKVTERLQSFYRQIAAYGTFPDSIQQLYQYSENSGLNIERISYRPQQTDLKTVLRYELEFSVTGQYREIKKFLQALEGWSQLVVVEKVRLAGGQPARDAVVLSIRLAAYFNTVSS